MSINKLGFNLCRTAPTTSLNVGGQRTEAPSVLANAMTILTTNAAIISSSSPVAAYGGYVRRSEAMVPMHDDSAICT